MQDARVLKVHKKDEMVIDIPMNFKLKNIFLFTCANVIPNIHAVVFVEYNSIVGRV